MPYLRGALVVGFAILLAVFVHALWTRVRANRHDLAVLRVVGCTRRQLDAITAWQAAPFAARRGRCSASRSGSRSGASRSRRFAQSLAVVDDASISAALVVALGRARCVVAAVVADLVAVAGARRTRAAAVLRRGLSRAARRGFRAARSGRARAACSAGSSPGGG